MNKLLLPILLISSAINANNDLFGNDFNHNVWRDFEQQFRQFDYKTNQIQNSSNFSAQSRKYFYNQTNSYIIQIKVSGL